MDPTTQQRDELAAPCKEDPDTALDVRLAEDPLQRGSLELANVVIQADLAAEQSFSEFDRRTAGLDHKDDRAAEVDAAAPVTTRQRRAQSAQIPTGRALTGIRGAVQQLYNRSRSYRLPADTARSMSSPEPVTTSDFTDNALGQEAGLQAEAQSQLARRANAGMAGATKLYAGWLKKLPRSRAQIQCDDSSLWKRRYVTLVRQNRRGPFWKDALLVYHKTDGSESTPLGFVSLSGALVFTTREDENGAAFHVIHTTDKDSFISLAAHSLAERQRWLVAIEKAGVRVKSIFC